MKKNLVISGAVGVILFSIALFSRQIGLCPSSSYNSCAIFFDRFAESLTPVFPFLAFSISSYFMSDRVFRTWSRFAVIWVPLSIVAIALTPEYSGDFLFPIVKGTVALGISLLFVIISLGIIGLTSLKKA